MAFEFLNLKGDDGILEKQRRTQQNVYFCKSRFCSAFHGLTKIVNTIFFGS